MISLIRRFFPVYITLLALSMLGACKGTTSEGTDDATKLQKSEVEEKVREVVYPLPSTYEVTEMLNEIQASYILGLTNDLANAEKYFTDKKQALNLGIYSADLSYASTYNMKLSQDLVKELGITGAFSLDFVEQVEANVDNKDKLIELITNSFYDTYAYLVKNDKEDLSLLVVASSWIEALYITTHISETTYENPKIVEIIMKQKRSLGKLIELLEPHKDHETIQQLLVEMRPMMDIYNQVGESSITKQQLETIVKHVIKLRTDIVS